MEILTDRLSDDVARVLKLMNDGALTDADWTQFRVHEGEWRRTTRALLGLDEAFGALEGRNGT